VARFGRLALVSTLVITLGLVPIGQAAAITPGDAVNEAVGYASARSVTSYISVVDRATGNVMAQTGNANDQVASESIMKLFLAAYYLRLYGGANSTPQSVKERLSYMIRYSDDGTASSLFSADAIPTIRDRYGLNNTSNATDRAGHWGAARITAADMTRFLFQVSRDDAVGPWLLSEMSRTERYGSDNFDQGFGLNALGGEHGSKQGWGCDSFWTYPSCAIHSVGYTDRYFVAVLQLATRYPDPMRVTSTHSAWLAQISTPKPDPIGTLDSVSNPSPGTLVVSGWAADPAAAGYREEVHVYVTGPNGTAGYGGIYTDGSRPDVMNYFPWAGGSTGFSGTVQPQGAGNNNVCAFAINVDPPRTNPLIGCRTIDVRNSFGTLDDARAGAGQIFTQGWALNPNNPGEQVEIHIYDVSSAGQRAFGFRANTQRADVDGAYPGFGNSHGFVAAIPLLAAGSHNVCAYSITTGGGSGNTQLGCRALNVPNAVGWLDQVNRQGGNLVATGWTFNPTAPGETVEIRISDTSSSGAREYPGFQANGNRGDVAGAYPGLGNNHGFSASIPVNGAGAHTICAIAVTGGSVRTTLGCLNVSV